MHVPFSPCLFGTMTVGLTIFDGVSPMAICPHSKGFVSSAHRHKHQRRARRSEILKTQIVFSKIAFSLLKLRTVLASRYQNSTDNTITCLWFG